MHCKETLFNRNFRTLVSYIYLAKHMFGRLQMELCWNQRKASSHTSKSSIVTDIIQNITIFQTKPPQANPNRNFCKWCVHSSKRNKTFVGGFWARNNTVKLQGANPTEAVMFYFGLQSFSFDYCMIYGSHRLILSNMGNTKMLEIF